MKLPAGTPSWVYPSGPTAPALPAAQLEAFLGGLSATRRRIVLLTHGAGLTLGQVASVLRLDPALVSLHLLETLRRPENPEAFERALSRALRDGRGPAGLNARLAELPEDARERLQAVASGRSTPLPTASGAGLGIGTFALILLAVAAFLVYGVIRDDNPLWRGQDLMRRGEPALARRAFEDLGPLVEARKWMAMAWMAEGEYARVFEVLAEPGVAEAFGAFRPPDRPLAVVDADPTSAALLPRGLVSTPRPSFVYRANAGTHLTAELVGDGDGEGGAAARRPLILRVAHPEEGAEIARQAWPAHWPDIDEGAVAWSISTPEGAPHQATFRVMSGEWRREMHRLFENRLTYEMPEAVRGFLRAQYFLRNGLYAQAGEQYAELARSFPEQPHPREVLRDIAAALGVDPQAFLR